MVEVGKAEALLPWRERVPGEDWVPGVKEFVVFLNKLEQQGSGPELILSRSSLNFVRKLFEMEVAEIADGTVLSRSNGSGTWLSHKSMCQKY